MKNKKAIKSNLYLYANNHIPIRLMDIMIEFISGYDSGYSDKYGRLGIMGITKESAEKFGYQHQHMINYKKCLEVGSELFMSRIKQFRIKLPGISIDDLYLLVLATFTGKEKPLVIYTKNWLKYKKDAIANQAPLGTTENVEFAEKVWGVFKKMGGDIK